MGQFMGWASYDLKTRCEDCGEEGLIEDMDDHELCCPGPPDHEGDEPDEEGDDE